ncbi:MAG: hypothetical protein PHR92_13930 [Lachnospiraceae bacterium]|nr:hypothetical protein [Lachnospiraceae bacterium]
MAGTCHYLGCDGEDCSKALKLCIGDRVYLEKEPENEYDEKAVKVVDQSGIKAAVSVFLC